MMPSSITYTPEMVAGASGLDVSLVCARMEEGAMPDFDRDGGWSSSLVNDVIAGLNPSRRSKITPAVISAFRSQTASAPTISRRVRQTGDHPQARASDPDTIETFLSAKRVCAIFDWSRSTLYRKIREGSFPAADFAVPGSQSKWAKSTVQEFIEEGKARAAA